MTKRRKSTKSTKKSTNKSSKILTYIAWGLALIALMLATLMAGYYLGFSSAKDASKKEILKEKKERLALLKKLETSVKTKPVSINKKLQEVLKKERHEYISAAHELDESSADSEPKMFQRKRVLSTKKPRLAIIIDDVGTKSQVEAIKSLRLPLTMSFLPPSKARPHTPQLASHEKFYMVHLPMEAMHWSAEEPFTLRVSDSQQVISNRIKEIKKLFPKVHYINNHTGSKFTADETAMNRLIYALNKNNINFIDSRTTAQTKAPMVMKNFGKSYVARDVFLDHHMDKPYVLKQIKLAIKTAKSHGTAIAIGHPHKNTLQALYESKKLFKDVDLVYVYGLY